MSPLKITDRVTRTDSPQKLSGEAIYIEDMQFEGLCYAKTLRSTIALGQIDSVTYPQPPPGIWVVDWRDVSPEGHNEVAMILKDMPIFAKDRVTYVGEPLALVVGQNKDAVLAYLAAIKVVYTEEKGVFTLDQASDLAQNNAEFILSSHKYGRGAADLDYLDSQLGQSVQGFQDTYETGYQEQVYMEKQGVVGTYEEDVLTVYGSIQCPYYVVNALKHATGLPENKVRVIQAVTGGAFGGKEEYPSLLACQVAVATKKVGAPVQLIFDRREDMAYTTKRHPSRTTITSYVQSGKVVGMRIRVDIDGGSYIGLSDVVLQRAMLTLPGCYQIPAIEVSGRCLRTNNVFTGAFRGFGAPQTMFALELHMDQVARALGRDPIGFKREHFVHQGEVTSTGGIFNEPIYLEALTDKLVSLVKGRPPHLGQPDPNPKPRENGIEGYGFAIIPHGGGFTGDGEAAHIKAVVRLGWDYVANAVTIFVSNVEMGQGAITALSKIVAVTMGLEMDQVHYHVPDTKYVPDSGPTVASRTTMVVGGLLHRGALRLKEKIEINSSVEAGGSEPSIIYVEEHFKQPDYVKWDQGTLTGNAYMAYSWAAVMARVLVDPVTYTVTCTDVWSCYDVGVPIDNQLLLGQIHGGVVQGLGYALIEQMTSQEGRIEQVTFSSYPIPTTQDVPRMHSDWLENPYTDGPFGAKAVGELTLVGVAPAVAAAVYDAIGRPIKQLPITPERIAEVME